MPGEVHLELVARVRQLLEVEAPKDPDLASVHFDALVTQHGRAPVGAALAVVAPNELAEIVHRGLD